MRETNWRQKSTLSGGVDSSVVTSTKAVGKQLVCVRKSRTPQKGEPERVVQVFRDMKWMQTIYVRCNRWVIDKLAGVESQKKEKNHRASSSRFEEEAQALRSTPSLGGTIYPDILQRKRQSPTTT